MALEDIEPGHYVAWLLDLPGCFSSGRTARLALADVPEAVIEYFAWLHARDSRLPLPPPGEVVLVVSYAAVASPEDPAYLVNAFFEDDRRPPGFWELVAMHRLLAWSRADLLAAARPLLGGRRQEKVLAILGHVAAAENWYFSHVGLGLERAASPADPVARLDAVRAHTVRQLFALQGMTRGVTVSGERWSARKVMRRTLWHERDHTNHIRQLGPAGKVEERHNVSDG